MSKIEVNTVDTQCGSTLTLGSSGKTVTLASGASQSGFGRTGTVDWCTTAKTSPFTATSGDGFFVNTTSGAITVTLPSSPSAGDIVSFADYANTWQTNSVTVCRNGSKINSFCNNALLNTQGQSVTLIYVDGTRGWKNVQDSTSNVTGNPGFISATGGTITTSGDYKIHTFTGDGCFAVTNTFPGSAIGGKVSYMVVAGGGGGGGENATTTASAGGGAGGFREGKQACGGYTASPLAATPCSGLPVSVQTYPITVGGGGTGGPSASPNDGDGGKGSDSIFSTITSTGGGFGSGKSGSGASSRSGPGGSGGGAKQCAAGGPIPSGAGAGNDPPVAPSQGNPGGASDSPGPTYMAGGGGGATAAGGDPSTPGSTTGVGGAGATTSINATPTAYAGGGGAGKSNYPGSVRPAGPGGTGGGGAGATTPGGTATAGTANTGGGGGGGSGTIGTSLSGGGAGGSGVVIIRYKFQ